MRQAVEAHASGPGGRDARAGGGALEWDRRKEGFARRDRLARIRVTSALCGRSRSWLSATSPRLARW
jgi:hypothetical protein